MRYALPLIIALASPAVAGLLDQVPTESATLPGAYQTLANCAYLSLDKSEGAGIKKVDLQGVSRLALESSGIRYWELVFTATGPKQTRVDLSQAQTLFGPQPAPRVMPAVRACAG